MTDQPSEDVRAVLATIEAMDAPELHELAPRAVRELMGSVFADAPAVEAVGTVENTTVPGPDGSVPVRVSEPERDGPHPVVVFFRGGGFVFGGSDGHDAPCRILTNAADVATDLRDALHGDEYDVAVRRDRAAGDSGGSEEETEAGS